MRLRQQAGPYLVSTIKTVQHERCSKTYILTEHYETCVFHDDKGDYRVEEHVAYTPEAAKRQHLFISQKYLSLQAASEAVANHIVDGGYERQAGGFWNWKKYLVISADGVCEVESIVGNVITVKGGE